MLCVDLKNSFYQLPDIHTGLYDIHDSSVNDALQCESTKVQTIQKEKIICNDFFLDLTKQEQNKGK